MTVDFEGQRLRMVAKQIKARGISNTDVLRVMREVPRHDFVPAELRAKAYEDKPLAIGCGQTISQPYMVALMTELLELKPGDRVLEVGTGSAYQTAILASLAAEVISIERQDSLLDAARRRLEALEYTGVTILPGDGTLGSTDYAPYDAILVTAGSPEVPRSLREQLAPGGRLVCPVGTREAQKIVRLLRTPEGIQEEGGTACMFVPLIGAEGWSE